MRKHLNAFVNVRPCIFPSEALVASSPLKSDIVTGVNVACKPEDPSRYKNTRAELWDRGREWLIQDMPVEIPDSDELQTDLCGLGYKYDSSDKLQIESKVDAKKRGLLSPDCAEAFILTFYGGEYVVEGGYQVNRLPERTAGMLI